jgi:hypothetical protein
VKGFGLGERVLWEGKHHENMDIALGIVKTFDDRK